MRQHSDAQQVAPLILEIDGGAVLDGGEAELFYIGPLAASTLRDASNESFCLLECPRIVMFATSTGTVLTGFASSSGLRRASALLARVVVFALRLLIRGVDEKKYRQIGRASCRKRV